MILLIFDGCQLDIWTIPMPRILGYVLVFVAGWLASAGFEVDTAIAFLDHWARGSIMAPWYGWIAG